MFASDRFAFETPNVIDPGDLPPSAPLRRGSSAAMVAATGEDYQEARESRARLLNDIQDLHIAAPTAQTSQPPYDPYGDDDDDDEGEDAEYGTHGGRRHHHSLPSVEEARQYATALLQGGAKRSNYGGGAGGTSTPKKTMSSLGRTVPVPPSKHLVRQRVLRVALRLLLACVGLAVLLLIGIRAGGRRNRHRHPPQPPHGTENGNAGDLNRPPAVSVDRLRYITDFLVQNTISSPKELGTNGTPQNRAALWMAQTDTAIAQLPSNPFVDYRFVQRYVLAVLFFALEGTTWKNQASFLTPSHECSWFAAEQFDAFIDRQYAVGVTCDAEKFQVRDIFLPSNHLKGGLPSELRFLPHLEMLALPDNQIMGTIPSALKTLSHLVYLDLKYNDMTGEIPVWVGDYLTDLEVLGLSNNAFTGTIPTNIASLTALHTLALDDNTFTGSLTFANSLTQLQFFYADRNSFTGTLDDSFLRDLDSLHELDLSSNQLTGTVWPNHLFEYPTLHVLDLAFNKISAHLPTDIPVNFDLEFLSLRGNMMRGTIPSNFRYLRGLIHLDLHNNTFTGRLPLELKELSELTYLSLGYNNFIPSPEMPAFVDELTNLRELSLPSTQLTGEIPHWLGEYLPELRFLDLSHNSLVGLIPETLFTIPNLEYLLLHNNNLSGQIPSMMSSSTESESTGAVFGASIKVLTVHQNPNLRGTVVDVCSHPITFVATDCTVECPCCDTCCNAGTASSCPAQDPPLSQTEGFWEFGYDRAPFAFDPNILDENGLFVILHENYVPDEDVTPPESVSGNDP